MHAQRAFSQSAELAPWAEIVPDVGPTTVDDLLGMPDDGWKYEVVVQGFRHPISDIFA
jgi:hypothetical protein